MVLVAIIEKSVVLCSKSKSPVICCWCFKANDPRKKIYQSFKYVLTFAIIKWCCHLLLERVPFIFICSCLNLDRFLSVPAGICSICFHFIWLICYAELQRQAKLTNLWEVLKAESFQTRKFWGTKHHTFAYSGPQGWTFPPIYSITCGGGAKEETRKLAGRIQGM